MFVWDRVWLNDELIEETYDWYAQDKDDNVWCFGEDSKEYENGNVVSTKGSWEAGIDGAKPSIIMEANPQVGDSYRQEYYKGEAEDMADIPRPCITQHAIDGTQYLIIFVFYHGSILYLHTFCPVIQKI